MTATRRRGWPWLLTVAAMLLFLAGMPDRAIAADAKIWIGDDQATVYAALGDAAGAARSGDTIHISGDATLSSAVTIPDGVTLDVAGNTTLTGSGSSDGITLAGGAKMHARGGSTLTMGGFKTALTVQSGAEVNDGTYIFKDNQSTTRGINIQGSIKGSTDRNSVVIKADDKAETNFYSENATFENATIEVISQTWTWKDASPLNLKNVSMTLSGFGQGFYVQGGSIVDSYLYMKEPGLRWGLTPWGSTGMAFQGGGTVVEGSTIRLDYGSNAGISIGLGAASTPMTFENTTLDFRNGGPGGLNVNTGKVTLQDATIKGDGQNDGALFGAQTNGSITIQGDSLVETPASGGSDNGGGPTGQYVVVGGSHRIQYSDTAVSAGAMTGSTIPTNGAANGNEKLTYFQLADAGMRVLHPLSQSGKAYDYSVGKASSDGKKYVWVPGAKVTFKLNRSGAFFADGTTADKTTAAMRGYALKDAVKANGEPVMAQPENPSAPGAKFLGWFVKNSGEEEAYDPAAKVTRDTVVYAKWASDAGTYGVVYHTNTGADRQVTVTDDQADRSAAVLSYDAVKEKSAAFAIAGKTFKGWSVDRAGNRMVAVGDKVTVPADADTLHLYAQWEDKTYTVRYSANGGTFADDSIFKIKPDVFRIETDADGGEVAVVRKEATHGQTLTSLLSALDSSVTTRTTGIATATAGIATRPYHQVASDGFWIFADYYWYQDAAGRQRATIGSSTAITDDTTYYLKWQEDAGIERVSASATLKGDIWGPSRSATRNVLALRVDQDAPETFPLVGALQTDAIKSQMKGIETRFSKADGQYDQIKLSEIRSTFTAKLAIPEGVVIPKGVQATLNGADGVFTVKDTAVAGQKITVTMTLDTAKIKTYADLQKAVNGTDDWLTLRLPGFTLDKSVKAGERKTVVGTIDGRFSAYAELNDSVKKFDFTWSGTQWPDGKDDAAQSETAIQYTVAGAAPVRQNIDGDILIGQETEHQQVYPVRKADKLALTGAIHTEAIRNQMALIEKGYPDTDLDKIKIDTRECTFKATLTLPESLRFGDPAQVAVTPKNFGNGVFTVTDTAVNGRTITITMKLKDGIDTYRDLKASVDALGDSDRWMQLEVSDVVAVEGAFKAGETATVVGTIEGDMDALATGPSGRQERFLFHWGGTQWPAGKDAAADSADNSIRLTVQYVADPAPETPSTPDEPAAPGNPTRPQTPKAPDKGMTGKIKPTPKPSRKQGNIAAQTGDDANAPLYAGLGASALAGLALTIAVNKRRSAK